MSKSDTKLLYSWCIGVLMIYGQLIEVYDLSWWVILFPMYYPLALKLTVRFIKDIYDETD